MFLIWFVYGSVYSAEVVLQSVSNIDNDEIHNAHDGNSFKLIKLDQGCKIESHFYLSDQNQLSHYTFMKKDLLKVTRKTFRYHYEKDFEGSLGHVTDIYLASSTNLNIHDPDVKKDFNRYKALFPNQYLKHCEH
ncbi:hypothetical protein G9F32_08360 [Acinetobacter sp. 194]|uniref:hypothetical protein n=1 Tax=Acinetobacter shaoyimingii TaxID=2715164 RepID=UPI00140C2E0F|nr:hypothetical protein [Acinetobacter shaoyimingii]NHB58033.1 hypothetical protein [Acinetobacter shaoyimingii]